MSNDPWIAAMLRGDFATAWRISDRVLEERRHIDCSQWPRHRQFVWDGSSFDDKRVLVRCYHGLGDTIQFARLLEPLRARAREVTLWAQPALCNLLRSIRGVDRLMPLHDGVPDCKFDVDMELMEVGHALRIDETVLPGRLPYIYVPSTAQTLDRERLNVGIAWRSGDWNEARSIPIERLSPLDTLPHVRFHSLQFPPASLPFTFERMAGQDIFRMAQCMLALDLVISVDTMVAHLAGALGLPTWLLLNRDADWRWQASRTDSPWYPTMRIFRQSTDQSMHESADEWRLVIEAVRYELAKLARARLIATRGTRSGDCRASSN
jgi:hypothetical protein